MKKLFLIFFCFPIIGFGQLYKLDKANGYKTIKFDSHLNQFNNISYVKEDGSTTTHAFNDKYDSNLFDIFGEKYDLIHLIFDKISSTLVGIEIKTKPKTSRSAQIIMSCTKSTESLVNKYTKEIGKYSKYSLNTLFESFGFGKITWIGSDVVLELGLDKQDGSNLGGPSMKITNMGNFEYTHSKSVCFYKKEFYQKKFSRSGF